MAKPIKTLELHHPIIQLIINPDKTVSMHIFARIVSFLERKLRYYTREYTLSNKIYKNPCLVVVFVVGLCFFSGDSSSG